MNPEQVQRNALVDGLKRNRSITSKRVERAFRAVPRHLFVPDVSSEQAYQDQVIVVKVDDNGTPISSSSQPTMMAIMLEQLQLRQGMRVLEVGAGSGYNAALMGHIVGQKGHVVSIDIDDDLVVAARDHIKQAGYDSNVSVLTADGIEGYAPGAPYDRIILTAAGWDISPAWASQLKPNGWIIMPIVLNQVQFSVAFKRDGEAFVSRSITRCRFMPMRGELPGRNQALTIPLAPDVSMMMTTIGEDVPDVDADKLKSWLLHPVEDANTGIPLTGQEFASLIIVDLMADAQHLHHCHFYASGEATRTELFPYLAGSTASIRTTTGLIHTDGMMLLMRPPGTALPDKADFHTPFELWVRIYGENGRDLARQYVALLRAWEQAGRADEHRLSITLLPLTTDYELLPRSVTFTKRWNRAIIRWV